MHAHHVVHVQGTALTDLVYRCIDVNNLRNVVKGSSFLQVAFISAVFQCTQITFCLKLSVVSLLRNIFG